MNCVRNVEIPRRREALCAPSPAEVIDRTLAGFDCFAAPDEQRAVAEADAEVNWILRHRKTPPDVAGAASRAFLGVQIQCAQCHDHTTERWTQADFAGFAACG